MEKTVEKRNLFELSRQEKKQVEIEESLGSLSRYLDDWIKIPIVGWRFGLDALIGLVPNVGDTLTSFAVLYFDCRSAYGVPKITLLRWL